ncbi:MAG: PfkB family carbohydrate kinase [Candidatus Dojkabacteria bacterium]|nr:PfkB family carbohydrate kinase [Candidatus Dojkabacteria bacterium]MDQ7021869.1 PfkB family carbohydrate kinase [Candidatus Dojkabacteria bacterium]
MFQDIEYTIVTNFSDDFVEFTKGVSFLSKEPNSDKTLMYQNIVENGRRKQIAQNYDRTHFADPIEKIQEEVRESDLIIFAPLSPYYQIDHIKDILSVKSNTAKSLLLPQGYLRKFDSNGNVLERELEEVDLLFPLFDFGILSDEDLEDLSLIPEWTKKHKIGLIVTRGKDGADVYYGADLFDNGVKYNVSTTPVENIKDSTGSGEIFSASFAYMYVKTRDTGKSIAFGNKVAGRCLLYSPRELENMNLDKLFRN